MKHYSLDEIRNVCIIGSSSTGKTQLCEAIFYTAGILSRLGKVDEGNTCFDYYPDEIERKISINSKLGFLEWKDKKINLLDTPGYVDFIGEVIPAIYIADLVILNICPSIGVDPYSLKLWRYAEKYKKPVLIFLNKVDKEDFDLSKMIAQLKEKLSPNIVVINYPEIGNNPEKDIKNVIEIEGDFKEKLIEAVATTEDRLTEKYLNEGKIEENELQVGLKKGIAQRLIFPFLCGSGLESKGIDALLNFIVNFCPSPQDGNDIFKIGTPDSPFRSFVFKITSEPHIGEIVYFKVYSGKAESGKDVYNKNKNTEERLGQLSFFKGREKIDTNIISTGDIGVAVKLKFTGINDTLGIGEFETFPPVEFPPSNVERAVYPKSSGEEEKVSNALATFLKCDPTLKFEVNPETKEMILTGIGDLQLEVVTKRAHQRFQAEIVLRNPKIPYKETIRQAAQAQGKYKRQTGGHGQYGDCWIKIEPLTGGKTFEFVNKIVGGAIPSNYIPSVEKGIRQAMNEGVIAGYPLINIKATLFDGSYHEVDSSDIAFQIAGSMALKKAVEQDSPFILEPVMEIEVSIPEEYMGAVIGDLNSKRGKILGMDAKDGMQIIKAYVPYVELLNYVAHLRSLTHGSGEFKKRFSHYEEVPAQIAQQLIGEYQKARQEGR